VKLDKDGEFIICDEPRGRGRCGGRVLRVQPEDGRLVPLLLPGWERGDDGVYHEPPNDFKRRQLGYPARSLPERLTRTRNSGQSWLSPMLLAGPVEVRCSDCQRTHPIAAMDYGLSNSKGSMITEKRA
jgi:hypothetical protein